MVHWKAGAVNSDSGNGASVEVRAEDDNGKIYGEGLVRVTELGELATTLPRGEGPADLPDSIRGAVGFGLGGLEGLQETVARVAREAGLIPLANPARAITARPRIITLGEPGEGCLVVVDDPVAISASDRSYRGPAGPPNLDFIEDPAGLPGRKYLVVTDDGGRPIPPPRALNDRMAVFHGKDGDDERLALSGDFTTVYRTWQDAEEAIRTARERGVLP